MIKKKIFYNDLIIEIFKSKYVIVKTGIMVKFNDKKDYGFRLTNFNWFLFGWPKNENRTSVNSIETSNPMKTSRDVLFILLGYSIIIKMRYQNINTNIFYKKRPSILLTSKFKTTSRLFLKYNNTFVNNIKLKLV